MRPQEPAKLYLPLLTIVSTARAEPPPGARAQEAEGARVGERDARAASPEVVRHPQPDAVSLLDHGGRNEPGAVARQQEQPDLHPVVVPYERQVAELIGVIVNEGGDEGSLEPARMVIVETIGLKEMLVGVQLRPADPGGRLHHDLVRGRASIPHSIEHLAAL